MTELENKIYQIIASSNGIKGSDIANILDVEKKLVSSTLANSHALKNVVIQDNTYKWHVISNRESASESEKDEALPPAYDQELHAICNYYLNCIALESSGLVSQFLSNSGIYPYAVLSGLEIDPYEDGVAIQLLERISGNRDKKAYLGYPSRLYTCQSKDGSKYRRIAPVFLFPIEYTSGKVEISWLPSINLEILKGYADNGRDTLANELVRLENELGMDIPDADIDTDELVYRLVQIRQWDWAEEIDPYRIPCASDLRSLPDGIYNRPIVIEAEREPYTQGLESELMSLANMSEEGYRGTALHAWVKGDYTSENVTDIKPLLEVLPLNSEQSQAVETALRSDLTIVTGPPGTGKSQVVTDLLINIAWNGKSALFSSKNNKAVDVVDTRVNALCKRPVLLRIGNNQYAGRLAEIIEGLLNARSTDAAKSDMDYYAQEYNLLLARAEQLIAQKNRIIFSRNQLDEAEQKYCPYRPLMAGCFKIIDAEDKGRIVSAAQAYELAYRCSIKCNNGFFSRLFWSFVGPKREAERKLREAEYNYYAKKYGLVPVFSDKLPNDISKIVSDAGSFEEALAAALDYKHALDSFKSIGSLEQIDKILAENKASLSEIAYKLWNSWLSSKSVSFSTAERSEMADYVAAMKLAGGVNLADEPELRRQFSKMSSQMTHYLQCWAVTSLSAKSRVPFTAGLFDYVIIDEASQCDIASILPLLFRAKKAVIIGDPKQLSHISNLSPKQDLALIKKYNVPMSWSYFVNSLYAIASSKVDAESIVQLKDHFRSCSDIIEFSNEVFYDGTLRTATQYSSLRPPNGENPGIRWIDTIGDIIRPENGSAYNMAEAAAVVKELIRLLESGYDGTIGVTTPFRKQVERIKSLLEQKYPRYYELLLKEHEFIVDTVHKFQGDERDLMIFSTVVSADTPDSTIGFLCSTGNLFNVAITRARAVLVIVGDHSYCRNCSIDYLQKFAKYCDDISSGKQHKPINPAVSDSREYPWIPNPEQVSDWEKTFYTALFDAGIQTIPQYPADKYRLDLAIVNENGKKLDIEVDGEMYHRRWNGELCYRDQLRNQRLFELGWDVKRFWVYQIRDDTTWCVEQIKDWCDSN